MLLLSAFEWAATEGLIRFVELKNGIQLFENSY